VSTTHRKYVVSPKDQQIKQVKPNERAEERVKIRAARLRLVTDRRLNKVTPQWVKDLAKKPV
jgi:hypothetical protein